MEKELKELLKNVILNQVAINARIIHKQIGIQGTNISFSSVEKAIEDFNFVRNYDSPSLRKVLQSLDL